MKNFISPVLIVLVMVIGYFYIMPLYDHVNLLKMKKDRNSELLQSIQDIGVKISSLENQYNSFTPREKGLLTRLIPRQVREAVIVNDLTDLAKTHDLIVTGVEFEPQEKNDQNVQSIGETKEPTSRSQFEKWNTIISVQGKYDGFKGLLTDLGKSVRIADVSHISVKQNTTGGLNLVEYQITVTIYSIE